MAIIVFQSSISTPLRILYGYIYRKERRVVSCELVTTEGIIYYQSKLTLFDISSSYNGSDVPTIMNAMLTKLGDG